MNSTAHKLGDASFRSIVCVVICVAGVAVACADTVRSLFDELARRDCLIDSPTRVSDERVAYLFAHNHVYRALGDDLIDWANGLANTAIPTVFDDLNEYLDSAGIGIQVLSLRSFVTENDDMAPVAVDAGGRPQEPSRTVIHETSASEPQFVHTYWSPGATTLGVGGYGGGILPDKGYVGIIERPIRPRDPVGLRRSLAHELGHFLGLGHEETIADNLMSDPHGDDLTQDQIATMRRLVNTGWTLLMVMSCTRDPALANIIEQHSADEILRAAELTVKRTG